MNKPMSLPYKDYTVVEVGGINMESLLSVLLILQTVNLLMKSNLVMNKKRFKNLSNITKKEFRMSFIFRLFYSVGI